jgi:hypothetical protein
MSVFLAEKILIDQCKFSAPVSDRCMLSTYFLVLASSASRSHVHVLGTSFESSAVVKVLCVEKSGAQNPCLPSSASVTVVNSTISQRHDSGNSAGSADKMKHRLMLFGSNVSRSFTHLRLTCHPKFVVFKTYPLLNVEYSCGKCDLFQVSLSGSSLLAERLEALEAAVNVSVCVEASSSLKCPYGIADCTTFINVTSGFWTNYTNVSNSKTTGILKDAKRCPRDYCGCAYDSCRLAPLLDFEYNTDSLCIGNRTGYMCGGCPPNSTVAIDGKRCIKNEDCRDKLWWLWVLSILGYALFSLFIVASCGQFTDNSVECVLFYSQISSFASVSPGSSSYLIKFFELSQLQSVTVVDGAACYAPDMSSYDVTVAKLVGPLFVLFFSVTWTWVLRALQPQLLLRNIRISVSYSGTLMASILFSFSVVSQVVFTLVECTQYDETGVVFIDGTVPCYNRVWKGLMVIVVLLCLFPVLFFASLKMNKLSENARAVVCHNLTQPAYYWSAVTLGFRLLISIMQFLQVRHPNLLAFIRMLLSTSMLVLHTHTRPYRLTHAFWIDVVCYLCLSAQFGLQMMFADLDFLAVIPTNNQEKQFYGAIESLSSFFRFVYCSIF